MFKARFVRKVKLALLTAFAVAGGTMFSSCGLTDIRDNVIDGALGAVKGAAQNWVGSIIINLNEVVDPYPDQPLIPTP